ncbi:MAG: hypothetical protein QHI38_02680 [Armatimonadota bacterium]|nr:hypothetical protein [Armatimonadota bacterium]
MSVVVDERLTGKWPFKRLFLDAMVVEESDGLQRVFHAAEKHPANPIIVRDKPWEGWGPYVYGTVMWDEGKLKMWYQVINPDPKIHACALYAESTDGIHWTKPNLGIVSCLGSTENNVFAEWECAIPSVMKLANPDSADNQWAVYSYGREYGPHVAFSRDGLRFRWFEKPEYVKLFETSDVVNFFYDPYHGRYVCTYKCCNRRHRAVGIALSNDGIKWYKPIEGAVFGADDLDPDPTQIYGMPVFCYQGCYIGLPWIYHARWIKYGTYTSPKVMYEAQEGSPCTVDVQLAWSWDLIGWTRTPKREPFISLGKQNVDWDWGMIYTARAPVVVDDKLYFYYGGFDRLHDADFDKVRGAIGLATLRLDGFCSMRASSKEGWMISRREVFNTPCVTINARTASDGYVVAELLDRYNNVIPGFSRAECVPFVGDSLNHMLRWRTERFPTDMLDKDKKVKFYLRKADLYSYLPVDINTQIDFPRFGSA